MLVTARKRSLRRLCFYRCLSVHRGGACMVTPMGGMCGCSRGGMRGCSQGGMSGCSRGHAWLLQGGICTVAPRGVCMVAPGGACMVAPGGHAWLQGGHAWFFRWDAVNERAVRILLECILVFSECERSIKFRPIKNPSASDVSFLNNTYSSYRKSTQSWLVRK